MVKVARGINKKEIQKYNCWNLALKLNPYLFLFRPGTDGQLIAESGQRIPGGGLWDYGDITGVRYYQYLGYSRCKNKFG